MKMAFRMTGSCVALAFVLLASRHAAADESVASAELGASVTLLGLDNCTLVVGAPSHGMEMRWTRNTDGKGVATLISDGTPSEIVVTATGGEHCTLNSLRLTTTMGDGAQQGPDHNGQNFTWFKPFGDLGGQWRFMPYLARARFYTDEDHLTEGKGQITWHSPSKGYDMTFSETAQQHAGETATLGSMGGEVMFMTDQYVLDGGALLIDGSVNTGTFSTDRNTEKYRSAILGFGALVATGPENAQFIRDDKRVSGNGQINMSWTVTVSQA